VESSLAASQEYQQVNGKFIRVLTEELLFVEKVAAGEQMNTRAGVETI
jgi:hypothetical protein